MTKNNDILYWDVLWKFSQKISENVLDNEEGNCIFSPLSAALSLSLVTYGAKGGTKEILTDLLIGNDAGFSIDEFLRWVLRIQRKIQVTGSAKNGDINIQNVVFINEGVYFQPNFRQTLIDVLHPQMESFNFDSDVLDLLYFQKFFDVFKTLSAMDTIAITASILFRGFIWPFGTQLADSDANIGPFQISAGGTEIKKFTETIDYYNFTEMPGIGAKAVEIPLKNDGLYSILIILPDEGKALHEVEKLVFKEKLHYIMYNMNRSHIKLMVPMFSLESTVNLEKALKKMKEALFSSTADFSGITICNRMKMPKTGQHTVIELREERNAQVKRRHCIQRERPKIFGVNRPFLFYVVYRLKDKFPVVLLDGRICNPQQTPQAPGVK